MRHARAIARLCALACVVGVMALAWSACRPLALLSRPLARRVHRAVCRCGAPLIAAIFGMRIETAGSAPRPPFVLVCNHLSYMDIVVLSARLDCVFLSKAEVARWPFVGLFVRAAGTLFVDRTRRGDLPRVIEDLRAALAEQRGVVVFPEGTSSPGEAVLDFKPSIFEVAVRTELPVSYASLSYRTPADEPPARDTVCWWGDMSFLQHVYRLLAVPSFEASLVFGREPLAAGDRKELARAAHRAVSAGFVPVSERALPRTASHRA